MSNEKELKKALHRTILKAMRKPDRTQAVDDIVADLDDPNMLAEVPSKDLPVNRQGTLHKDSSISELHQQKQMNAQAALGMRPKQPAMPKKPQMAKFAGGALFVNEEKGIEGRQNGLNMLKGFVERKKNKAK